MQTEYVNPTLANRSNSKEWPENGQRDLIEKVIRRKNEILSLCKAPYFGKATDREMRGA